VLAHRPSRWGVRCAMTSAGVTGDKRTALAGLARWGLASRGVIYLLMAALAGHLGGAALLGLLAGGFGGYALWRFSEAAFGVRSDPGTFPRVRSALRGVAYAGLAATTTLILTGSGGGGSHAQQQQSLTARAMAHTGGRVLVTLIGLVIVGAGLAMAAEGITKSFEKHLRMAQMSPSTRRCGRSRISPMERSCWPRGRLAWRSLGCSGWPRPGGKRPDSPRTSPNG